MPCESDHILVTRLIRNHSTKVTRNRWLGANPSPSYLAEHVLLAPVRVSSAFGVARPSSLRRPRAQVHSGCEERMGEPRFAEDLWGKAAYSMSCELDVLPGFPPRPGRLRCERE
jgi:hypothetical protein